MLQNGMSVNASAFQLITVTVTVHNNMAYFVPNENNVSDDFKYVC